MMPSADLAPRCATPLNLLEQWTVNGTHYEKTSNAWLKNMDAHRDAILPVLEKTYGAADVTLWWNRWRIFFIACAEVFGYAGGKEWPVMHYLFQKPVNS
jgi:cyclopropane-fatty-acyl-phospholipid synthase